MSYFRLSLGACVALCALYFACCTTTTPRKDDRAAGPPAIEVDAPQNVDTTGKTDGTVSHPTVPVTPAIELPSPVERALDWLAGAQQQDGGWGAGSHNRQNVRDAHAVPTDPATTAAAVLALMRAGSGLDHGDYADSLRRGTEYLLATVEAAKDDGPRITELTGTQPQAKMGQNVDTALTAQYLARLLQDLGDQNLGNNAELRPRVTKALDKCLDKIQDSQAENGAWTAGGWAPVLQSSQMCTALELAQLAGRKIDGDKLALARTFQRNQMKGAAAGGTVGGGEGISEGADASVLRASYASTVAPAGSAGVMLYASASNMRNAVAQSKAAEEIIETAKKAGKLPKDAKVEAQTLADAGIAPDRAAVLFESFSMNAAAKVRAFDENVLAGFGNNGGEEFLSYQMKSESLVIDGGEEWDRWSTKMHERLAKVQNPNGSWSGHHCITSPTFCTATAISCLTADRDVEWLRMATELAAK